MSNISKEWLEYLDGKITINDIIEAYESRGFDSNQDIPGNYHWEELYQALGPETKVILTVRDDTERWWSSYVKFFTQETERAGCGGFNYGNFYSVVMSWGLMGPDMERIWQLNTRVLTEFSDPAVMMKSWSVKTIVDAIKASEPGMKQRYDAHNAKVQATIPTENLLVWNLKDGWEPVCNFLGKSVPDKPIPRENQTGDLAWGEEYLYEDGMMVKAFGWLLMYLLLIIILIIAIAMAIYLPLRYKSD